ncbi:MAG: DUF362 domain-containing protein [Anaerolineae bacterium]|nr:DUF362 domain-containing protein [Anaerolineae bacterium]
MSKISRQPDSISRRDFLKAVAAGSCATLLAACTDRFSANPVVSIVKIKNSDIQAAVEEAIQLLGGIERVAANKDIIMLKPNLVQDTSDCTTNPEVVFALASLMQKAGKEVWIGEGSAGASGYITGPTCYLQDTGRLIDMQQAVFDRLGYTELADNLGVPLVNLHTGPMVDVAVPGGLAYQELTIHRSLTEIDMLCSVPMMKTHDRAMVTLGMKNLIGLYPGETYGSIRSSIHDHAAAAGSEGIAFEIIDMVRAIGDRFGLVVIDGSMAMEGNGPTAGLLVDMDVIIAGTNPLATDMVAASVMGFEPDEVPHFVMAGSVGMQPTNLGEIEIRGESISSVERKFKRPEMNPWFEEINTYEECL